MYKEQRGGEAPRKFSFSVFICIQKEELEVGVSGHHNSGQEASRDRKHITLWSSRLVKVEGRPDTLFSSSPLTASRTWSPCRCLPPQSPTKNTEHVKHMSLFLGPQIHPVNVHKMVVECRPAAQEPMKYSRFPLIPHPLLGELKYSALVWKAATDLMQRACKQTPTGTIWSCNTYGWLSFGAKIVNIFKTQQSQTPSNRLLYKFIGRKKTCDALYGK